MIFQIGFRKVFGMKRKAAKIFASLLTTIMVLGCASCTDGTWRTIEASEFDPEWINERFTVEGAEIGDTETELRFIFHLKKDFLHSLPKVMEYGAITLPTDRTGGKEMFLDTPIVTEWKWDNKTKSNFTPKTTGDKPIKVAATHILEENEEYIRYALCLTDIAPAKYDEFHTVRGYIKYKNVNGATKAVYTDDFESSLYKVAAETPEQDRTDAENAIMDYVEGDRVKSYFATNKITARNAGYKGNADADPNHKIYTLSNGLVVRDVTVSGYSNTEKTEIAFITDPHFNYINEKDIIESNENVISSYRGRSWLRDNSQLGDFKKAMTFASMFKKTVMGGDAVDYLSKGSLEMTQRLLTNQSVNGSIKMVMGNHEYMEYCQPDIAGLTNEYLLEERYAMVQNYWTNDVIFDYEIMKKSDGITDNIMLIYMDNAANQYWASQIPKLESALSEARSKNIPVLIFQHIPILTQNPNETNVYYWEGYQNFGKGYQNGNTQFGTADKNSGVVDMTSDTGFPGSASSSEETMTVYNMIRKNYDIIKGVFCGHMHANMYTEIIGINADGTTAADGNGQPYVIPQHTGYGVHYNSVMKITVE